MKLAFEQQIKQNPNSPTLFYFDSSEKHLKISQVESSVYQGLSNTFMIDNRSAPAGSSFPFLKKR